MFTCICKDKFNRLKLHITTELRQNFALYRLNNYFGTLLVQTCHLIFVTVFLDLKI